jgi:hypothetical protein
LTDLERLSLTGYVHARIRRLPVARVTLVRFRARDAFRRDSDRDRVSS